jgi:type I restriction enzyme, S subunit
MKTYTKSLGGNKLNSNWRITSLGNEIELLYGKGLTKKNRVEGPYPIFGSNGVIDYHNDFFVKGPGIIIGRKGSVGTVKYSSCNFWPIDTTYYVKMKNENSLIFFYYLLHTLNLDYMNTHSAVPGLNRENVYSLKIIIPKLIEQNAISSILKLVDDKIENNIQMNNTLEQIAKTIFKSWFVDFEPFRDPKHEWYLGEDGLEYNEEMGKEMPKTWRILKLKDILLNNGYIRGPFGSSLKRSEMKSDGIPIYEQANAIYNHRNFRYFIDQKKLNELKRFRVQTDDIIVSCSGTIGRISIITKDDPKGIISQALLILRANKEIIFPLFLKLFFESPEGYNSIISRSSGSVQVNIARRQIIEDIDFILPSNDTNLDLLLKFQGIIEVIYNKINNNNDQIIYLTKIRDLLLPHLITGKLRIPDPKKFLEELDE